MNDGGANPDCLDERRNAWLDHLTDANRMTLGLRFRLIERWGEAIAIAQRNHLRETTATDAFLRFIGSVGEKGVTRGTLYTWRRGARVDGHWGLIDLRWLKSRPDSSWQFVRSLVQMYTVKRCRKLFLYDCHRRTSELADDYNWPRLTFAESVRWLKQYEPASRQDQASSTPV